MKEFILKDLREALGKNREAEEFMEKAIAQLAILDEPIEPEPVTNIKVKSEGNHIIVSADSKEELNILYQYVPENLEPGGTNPEKIHSVVDYVGDVDEDKPIKIWIGKIGLWRVQIVSLDSEYVSGRFSVFIGEEDHNDDESDDESDDKPDPVEEVKKITIHEDSKNGVFTPGLRGLIEYKGKWRLYTFDRRGERMVYFESDNLENWEGLKKAANQTKGTYFQLSSDDIIFYREKYKDEEGDQIKVFDVSDDLKKLTFKGSYDWKLDGALNMNEIQGDIFATGRVRGNSRDRNKGGWGGIMPDYPKVDDIPRIEEAFKKYAPDWMHKRVIDEVLKDRRGISLHVSADKGKTWSRGDIIAAPEWYDTPETSGWNEEKENGIADFYSSVLLDESRMLVKLYKKEKDRVIERGAGDFKYDFRRRFRFTGETIIVPAILNGGRVELLNNSSVIPRNFHERKTPKDVPNPTCKDCVEVGQMQPFHIVEKDGYVYVFYGYRDDIHYENDFDFYAGLYIAKFPKKEFDKMFK